MISMKYDEQEICFAYSRRKGEEPYCSCLTEFHKDCGTCKCPLFKPVALDEWVRRDRLKCVDFLPPEETESIGREEWQG